MRSAGPRTVFFEGLQMFAKTEEFSIIFCFRFKIRPGKLYIDGFVDKQHIDPHQIGLV